MSWYDAKFVFRLSKPRLEIIEIIVVFILICDHLLLFY